MQTSDWISGSALLVSLLSFGQNYLRDRYKKPRIFASIISGAFVSSQNDFAESKNIFQIEVNVTNEQRAPIFIASVSFSIPARPIIYKGLEIPGSSTISTNEYASGKLPLQLTENQTHRFLFAPITYKDIITMPRIIDILVSDSRGRIYRVPVENNASNWPD